MAESAAYARRGFKGGAKRSTIAAGLSDSATTFTGADLSTWAGATTNGPTRAKLDAGLSTEEIIEIGTISGNNCSSVVRGIDGTSAVEHGTNCTIDHVPTARDFNEMNLLVSLILGLASYASGDILYVASVAGGLPTFARLPKSTNGKVLQLAAGLPSWVTPVGTAVFYTTHTWAISGEIKVPSGDTDFLVPMFAAEGANEVVVLDKLRYKINGGTSVTFKMQVNGSDATGFTGLSATTTAATTDPADVALTDLDVVVPVVTAVSGTPKNLTVTAFLKHTVTLT